MRLLHTVRHLRAEQVAGQIAHRVRRQIEDPAKLLAWQPPPFPGCRWNPTNRFLEPIGRSNLDGQRFTFLNQTQDLGWPPAWDQPARQKLWQYNLHYFEYLWSLDYAAAKLIALHWMEHHTPARGRVGWEPYPTSLRLMNWCGVFFGKLRSHAEEDSTTQELLWQSIWRQAEWLSAHPETHLMGNHLLENAAALCVAGACFGMNRWFEQGMQLLARELPEQVLSDGGHFERSPMYHCRLVYLLTMLRNLGVAELSRLIDDPFRRASQAMLYLTHPDGRIALLNDSALGICNEPAELAPRAALPVGHFVLPDTGYFGARTANGNYLICDAAPIGPDYLPGHAHGDMLSFELSLGGHRVIVDSGVFDYEPGIMRDYCRSTRAHNTAEIDGQDQCEFWGTFRVGRRGHVRDVKWVELPDGFELQASHDGYQRLAGGGGATHSRMFRWNDAGRLELHDLVTSSTPRRVSIRLHLHPGCKVASSDAQSASIDYPGGSLAVKFTGPGGLSVETALYCPEFGKRLANQVLTWSAEPSTHVKVLTEIVS